MVELKDRIPVKAQQELVILYKGKPLEITYVADYVANDRIIIEIKALDQLGSREEAQILNYLKVTSFPFGLLINFSALRDLEWKCMVFTDNRSKRSRFPKAIRED